MYLTEIQLILKSMNIKKWLEKFLNNIRKKLSKNSNILIGGDFNIIPEEIDVYDFKRYENDALGRLEIRKRFREILNLGFKDVYRLKNKINRNILSGIIFPVLGRRIMECELTIFFYPII